MVTVALELARELQRDPGPDGELTIFCSRERPEGLDLGSRAVLSPWRHEVPNKLRWLPAVEREADLDAMLYPYWPCPPRRRPGAPPAAMFVHDLAFRATPDEVPWQQRAYLGSILPGALRQAALVIAPSAATRRDLLLHYPLPRLEDRVHVVPEASNLHRLEPAPLPYGLRPGFVLAVGTIEPRKNYARLLAAHRLLRERGLNVPLVVAGRVGWSYGRALADLRQAPGVRVLGHVDDGVLRGLYQAAGALALPSLYEGFGLPLLEAMHEGLPAVAGDAGALPGLAGDAALLVDPEDPAAIADALERTLTDPELRRRLAAAGRARAQQFDWAASAARILALLRSVCG